ncbi:MAG: hypothetical protein ABI612_08200 [Betaproteobacteria bacterium]
MGGTTSDSAPASANIEPGGGLFFLTVPDTRYPTDEILREFERTPPIGFVEDLKAYLSGSASVVELLKTDAARDRVWRALVAPTSEKERASYSKDEWQNMLITKSRDGVGTAHLFVSEEAFSRWRSHQGSCASTTSRPAKIPEKLQGSPDAI